MLRSTTAALLFAIAAAPTPTPAAGQADDELLIDRWLFTSAESVSDVDPLLLSPDRAFPDRDRTVGPGYWTLVREDGRRVFEAPGDGPVHLAHAYLRAPRDLFVALELEAPECAAPQAWLNAQLLPAHPSGDPGASASGSPGASASGSPGASSAGDPGADLSVQTVRLARGWNTLLIALRPEEGCVPTVGARVRAPRALLPEETAAQSVRVRPQASRPPGIRANLPEGVVAVGTPRPTGLVWRPDRDKALVRMQFSLTAWGPGDAPRRPSADEDRPADAETPPRDRREGGPPGGPPRERGEGGEDRPARPGARFLGDAVDEDLETQRARMARQLLGPREPPAPAPGEASVRLDIEGAEAMGAAQGLVPGMPRSFDAVVEFDRARRAALDEKGVEAEVSWGGDERDVSGRLSAAELLEALHGPILLEGWTSSASGTLSGRFRIPDALGGFTLRVSGGEWTMDGEPVSDGILCGPCRRGQRLELTVTGAEAPAVRIEEGGYPAAADREGVPPATAWLRALEGDKERYLEMGGNRN